MASPIPPRSSSPPCCGHALFEGVTCELPRGHAGSHTRAETEGMAALTWRSSSRPPPAPTVAESLRTDYLELLRATRRPLAKSA